MKYGTILNGSECRDVFAPWGMSAMAMVDGSRTKLAYWESLFDMFAWACDECGFDYETSEWVDGFTGEVLDYWQVMEYEAA